MSITALGTGLCFEFFGLTRVFGLTRESGATRRKICNGSEKFTTHDIVIVRPDTAVGDTAEALLNRRISGVHVVDPKKKLIAIVSEGDLMRRPKPGPSGMRGGDSR